MYSSALLAVIIIIPYLLLLLQPAFIKIFGLETAKNSIS